MGCSAIKLLLVVALRVDCHQPDVSHQQQLIAGQVENTTDKVPGLNCPMNSISIVMDQKPEGVRDHLTAADIQTHFAKPEEVEWARISETSFTDIDGRNDERVLSTPGGDVAEFMLAYDVWAKETGAATDLEEVLEQLSHFLIGTQKKKFQLTTTDSAIEAFKKAIGDPDLKISDPSMESKMDLLDKCVIPDLVGNDHISALLTKPADYKVETPEVVENVLKSFHLLMWNRTFEANKKLKYTMLSGMHQEKAFVNIQTDPICLNLGLAPLIAPKSCKAPLFVAHIQAVTKLRSELATFFAKGNAGLKQTLVAKMNIKGTYQLSRTAIALNGAYPVFTVTYTVKNYD